VILRLLLRRVADSLLLAQVSDLTLRQLFLGPYQHLGFQRLFFFQKFLLSVEGHLLADPGVGSGTVTPQLLNEYFDQLVPLLAMEDEVAQMRAEHDFSPNLERAGVIKTGLLGVQ
jgi:hypothetical protein